MAGLFVTAVLGRIPTWGWLALGVVLLVGFAHLSGRWIEAGACHERALAASEQRAAEVLEAVKKQIAAADVDAQARKEREAKTNTKLSGLLKELSHADLPACVIPGDVMRMLDAAGRGDDELPDQP